MASTSMGGACVLGTWLLLWIGTAGVLGRGKTEKSQSATMMWRLSITSKLIVILIIYSISGMNIGCVRFNDMCNVMSNVIHIKCMYLVDICSAEVPR